MLLTRRRLLYSALGSTAGLLAGSEPLLAREMAPRRPRCAFLAFNANPGSKTPLNLPPIAQLQIARTLLATRRWVAAPILFPTYALTEDAYMERQEILDVGHKTGADILLWGHVVSVSFTKNPRRARVTLGVHVDDTRTGYQINGAIETGFSLIRHDRSLHSDQVMLKEAVSSAARNVAQTIASYRVPTAAVLGPHGSDEVIVDRGAQDGMTPNLNLVVFRGRERVAKIKITRLGPRSAAAILVHGSLPRPGDRATAIFELPGYSVTAESTVTMTPLPKPGQAPKHEEDSW